MATGQRVGHPHPDRERLIKAEVRSGEPRSPERAQTPWPWAERALAFPTRTLGTHGLSLTPTPQIHKVDSATTAAHPAHFPPTQQHPTVSLTVVSDPAKMIKPRGLKSPSGRGGRKIGV